MPRGRKPGSKNGIKAAKKPALKKAGKPRGRPKGSKSVEVASQGFIFKAGENSFASVQDKILIALDKLFEIAKAQLLDMFKTYVETRLAQDLPALIEHFISLFEATFKAHGITEEELYASLSDDHKNYLKMSAERVENPGKVTKKKGVTQVQSEQAQKTTNVKIKADSVDVELDFDLSDDVEIDTPEAKPGKKEKPDSVFDDLDIL